MLWVDEQRAIGQLMASDRAESPPVRGHAAFHRDYSEIFAPWLERFAEDVLSREAVNSDRLRLLQWALFGLVERLDEEREYGASEWQTRAQQEIRAAAAAKPLATPEVRLREDLAELGVLGAGRE